MPNIKPNIMLNNGLNLFKVKGKGCHESLRPRSAISHLTISQSLINKPLSVSVMLVAVFVVMSIVTIPQAMAGNSSSNTKANNGSVPSNVLRVFDKGYSCSHLVYDYGVTSAAQAHCGFSKYNGKIVELTTQCVDVARQKGQHSEIENILITGIEDFNELITNSGDKKGVCRSVLQNYSEFVSK